MTLSLNRLLGAPGAFVIRRLQYILNLTTFTMLALLDWFRSIRFFDRQSYRPLVIQIIFSGIDAMPTIIFLGLVTGFIFTFRMIALFESVSDTMSILIYVIGMEVGPMISAITLTSRTGSAITVDLGNMKLHKEIQSMEYLGIDINRFLVAPRIIGVMFSQLAVSIFFTAITLVSGVILSGLLISSAHFRFLLDIADNMQPMVLLIFTVKNILFGVSIGAIACFHGLKVEASPTEVPQQTQRSIMNIVIMLFVIDGLIALIML